MLKRLQSVSVITRLLISFAVVIVMFFAFAIYSSITSRNIYDMYRYRIQNTEARNVLLLKFHQELTEFRRLLYSSYYCDDWINVASERERRLYEQDIIISYSRMFDMSQEYIQSVSADEFFYEYLDTYTKDDLIGKMENIINGENNIGDVYRRLHDYYFLDANNAVPEHFLDYTHTIEDNILNLRHMESQVDDIIQSKIEEALELNRKVLFVALILTVIVSVLLAIITIRTLAVWAKKIEEKAIIHSQESSVAEANSQAKSRFLARMSHEIRTPISAVICVAEIQLHNPNLPKEIEEAFNMIYSSSSALVGILNDILDLSKIEAGKYEIINGAYEVASLLQDVLQMHAVSLDSKKFKFNVLVDGSLPSELIGDVLRLKQVLNNLISNAFKYTEVGTVEFSIKRMPHPENGMIYMMMTISDTGRGMTNEQIQTLLSDEYMRFNEAENRNVTGTGLGMPIVINLIKLMGAELEIESEPGEGTKIVIMLPQKYETAKELGVNTAKSLMHLEKAKAHLELEPIRLSHAKVLVVDDVSTNLFVARGLLGLYDIDPETCDNAMDAINKVKGGMVYDIIFMDHMMPELNGIDATKILRDLGYVKPIVALTANAFVGQAEEFLSNGFNAFIAKPIQTRVLHQVILKYIPQDAKDSVSMTENLPVQEITEEPEIEIDIVIPEQPDVSDYYNSPEIMAMAREEFLDTQQNAYAEVKEALDKKDMETARRIAHTVKGMANVIKEAELAKISQLIETAIFEGGEPSGEQLKAFEDEMNAVIERIT